MRRILLFVALMMGTLPAMAEITASGNCGAEGNGSHLTWTFTDDGTLTISGSGAMTDFADYSVVPWFAYKAKIKSVVFPEGLTAIGGYAFYQCSGLSGALNLPSGLTSIGKSAFENCTGLTGALVLPDNLTSLGNSAFANCSGLSSVTFPAGLTSIGEYAFYWCSELSGALNLPSGLTFIGKSAFDRCSGLSSVTFPAGLTSIGEYAFRYCSGLSKVTNLSATPQDIDGSVFGGISSFGDVKLIVPAGSKSAYQAHEEWKKFTIKERASGSCGENLTWVYEDDTLTISGSGAMYDFENDSDVPWWDYNGDIKSVVFPEGLTSIGNKAFLNCSGITGPLVLPDSLTSIGEDAFQNCDHITSVTFPFGLASIGKFAFLYCSGITGALVFPSGLTSIGDYAFAYCSGLTGALNLPSGLTSIGEDAFLNCSGITGALVLPDSLTSIGNYAFIYCSGITSVTFPAGLTSIGQSAFHGCSGISKVTNHSATPQDIDGSVFAGIGSLGDVKLMVPACSKSSYLAHDEWKKFDIEEEEKFTVTASANNTLWGVVSGGGEYECGDMDTLRATAAEHYHFVKWSDDSTCNPRVITVLRDSTFTAVFAVDTFTVAAVANNEDYGSVDGGGRYTYGAEATLTATAETGYKFVKWEEDNDTNAVRSVKVVGHATYTAVFAVKPTPPEPPVQQDTTYTITVKVKDNIGGTVSGSGTYKKDTTITITATANEGYKFVKWEEDNDTNAVRSVKVVGDATYTAVFAVKPTPPEPPVQQDTTYTIAVRANNDAWGTVSGSGTYKKDTTITITAAANEGYKFVKWEEDDVTVAERTVKVVRDATFTAVFEKDGSVSVEAANEVAFAVYPNPCVGRFTVEVAEEAVMEVYNAGGVLVVKDVLTAGKRAVSLNGAGVYFVKMSAGGRASVKRVIVR